MNKHSQTRCGTGQFASALGAIVLAPVGAPLLVCANVAADSSLAMVIGEVLLFAAISKAISNRLLGGPINIRNSIESGIGRVANGQPQFVSNGEIVA
jgi:hypothetical protein